MKPSVNKLLATLTAQQSQAAEILGPTGPRVIDLLKGRQRIALNAVKNQVTGQNVFLTEDETLDYMTAARDLMAELKPRTLREVYLAQRIIDNTWRCNRIAALENNLFALGTLKNARTTTQEDSRALETVAKTLGYEDDCAHSNAFEKLGRQEVRLTRLGTELEAQYLRRRRAYARSGEPWVAENCAAWRWYNTMVQCALQLAAARLEKGGKKQLDQSAPPAPVTLLESSTPADPLFYQTRAQTVPDSPASHLEDIA